MKLRPRLRSRIIYWILLPLTPEITRKNLWGEPLRISRRYFPFWDWRIVSVIAEDDYLAPVRLVRRAVVVGVLGGPLLVTLTLMVVLRRFVDLPLRRLIAATRGVAGGRYERLTPPRRDEIGTMMTAFNAMVDSLERRNTEAMPDGGVITIGTENRYVDQPVRGYDRVAEGDFAVLTVSDTGRGIPPEDLERIFEPFFTKKAMGRSGTGLGMAVVWGTVKDHRGYIDVHSREGRGTTFTLYFPVTREPADGKPTPFSIDRYTGRGEVILVVDDVAEQRRLATSLLTRLNYRVVTAAGGMEAAACLQRHPVDLVLLDMIMDPGMDGLETYLRLQALQPGVRTVIASGFSETERVREAQRRGAGAYLKKPYTLEKLARTVQAELQSGGGIT